MSFEGRAFKGAYASSNSYIRMHLVLMSGSSSVNSHVPTFGDNGMKFLVCSSIRNICI